MYLRVNVFTQSLKCDLTAAPHPRGMQIQHVRCKVLLKTLLLEIQITITYRKTPAGIYICVCVWWGKRAGAERQRDWKRGAEHRGI